MDEFISEQDLLSRYGHLLTEEDKEAILELYGSDKLYNMLRKVKLDHDRAFMKSVFTGEYNPPENGT